MKKKTNWLFLGIIYLTFISLGLPDSLLGVTWPTIYPELQVTASSAGLISMIVSGATIISSLQTMRLIHYLGVGKLVLLSVLLTACGLVGFSLSQSYGWFLLCAVPLGFGAGAIDTSLNDYVALHFKAHHMNWLHGFWGLGATLGPMIMGTILLGDSGWRTGYYILAAIQFLLVIMLIFSLPLWQETQSDKIELQHEAQSLPPLKLNQVLRFSGVKYSVLSFIFYVGIEGSMGLWGSSFLIQVKQLTVAQASFIVSAFYASLTIGRMLSGFVTFWLSNRKILYASEFLMAIGLVSLFFTEGTWSMISFLLIGLGCAAIFPTMIHETPIRFGQQHSGAVMSVQVGLAYIGTIALPPLLGVLGEQVSFQWLPICLLIFTSVLTFATYKINQLTQTHDERRL